MPAIPGHLNHFLLTCSLPSLAPPSQNAQDIGAFGKMNPCACGMTVGGFFPLLLFRVNVIIPITTYVIKAKFIKREAISPGYF